MAIPGANLLRNPIFERDFVALCRAKRWFVVRTALVGFAVLAVWLVFLGVSPEGRKNPAEIGRLLFGVLAVLEVVIVAAVTPALVADLVVSERRRNTLDVLLTTPLRPAGIVLGKLLSRLSLVLLLAAASFPAITVAMLFGGVRAEQVLALLALVAGTALFTGGIALYVSARARRLGTAAVLSYVLPLAAVIGYTFLLALIATHQGHHVMDDGVLVGIHPLFATLSVAIDEGWDQFARAPVRPHLVWLATGAFTAIAGTLLAVVRLAREGTYGGAAPRRGRRGRRRGRRALLRMRRPLLWKETRLVDSTHSKVLFRIVLALFLLAEVLFFAFIGNDLDDAESHTGLATAEILVLYLLVSVNAGSSVVSEREQGTLDLLGVTLLRPGEIVLSKFVGTIRSVAVLAAIPLAHLLLATAVTELTIAGALAFAAAFGVLLLFFAVNGLAFSISSRRPSRAILKSTMLLLGLLVAFPIAGVLYLIFGTGSDEWFFVTFFTGWPPVMPLFFADYASGLEDFGSRSREFLTGALLWTTAYGVLAWFRYAFLAAGYRAMFRREEKPT